MLGNLCESKAWHVSDLSSTGLLGWQPCFEDVILLLPVYLITLGLALYRIQLVLKTNTITIDSYYKRMTLIKIGCCVALLLINIIGVSITKQPAQYELGDIYNLNKMISFEVFCV